MSIGIRSTDGRKTGSPADDLPPELVKFRFDLPPNLPLPLAHLYSQMDTTPREGHGYAYFLFEALLKLTASTAAAGYLDVVERGGSPEDAAVDRALSDLAQPTTGKWVALLRSTAGYFAQAEEQQQHPLASLEDELQARRKSPGLVALHNAMRAALGDPTAKTTCSLMELFETATEYRNKKIGHGTVLPSRFCRDMLSLFVAAANEVLAPDQIHLLGPSGTRLLCLRKISLTDEESVRVDARELKGTVPSRLEPWKLKKADGMRLVQGHVAILWPERKMPLSLAPFLSFHQKRPNADIYFLNGGLGRPRVNYLSYLLDGAEIDAARTSTSERLARLVRGGRRRPDGEAPSGEAAPPRREPKTSPSEIETVRTIDDTVLAPANERATPSAGDSITSSLSSSGIATGSAGDAAGTSGTSAPIVTGMAEYEILGRLGRGGMGVVQLAWQESLGRWVALKTLPIKAPRRRRGSSDSAAGAVNTPATSPSRVADRRALKLFRREMQHLARCQHPNIIKVLQEITTPDRQVCYALEYVAGCNVKQAWHELCKRAKDGQVADLDGAQWTTAVCEASRDQLRRVRRRARGEQAPAAVQSPTPGVAQGSGVYARTPSASRPTPGRGLRSSGAESAHWPPDPELLDEGPEPGGYVRRVAMLGRDVARALQVVHDRRVVHRDVKPENLMLTSDAERVVLMDFGVAKKMDQKTKTNALRGTLPYAGPEQLDLGRSRIGPQADIHGLGVVLWELLARRPLFDEAEGDEDKLIDLLKYQDVPLLRTIDPSIHPDLEAIVDRAVKRSVKDRLQTAGLLADYLDRYLDDKEIEIRERPWQEKFRDWAGENRALVGSVVAALATVVIVTVVAFVLILNSLRNATVARNDADEQRKEAVKDKAQAETDRKEADKQRAEADKQKVIAQTLQQSAQTSSDNAKEQANIAQKERDKAVKLQQSAQRNLYIASIRLADEAKRQRDLGRTWDLLNSPSSLGAGSTLSSMRGWEWAYLSGVCRQSVIHAIPQQSSVTAVAWSRDGQLFATGDADGQLAVWSADTGQLDPRWAKRQSSGVDFDVDFGGSSADKITISSIHPDAPDKTALPQKGDLVVAIADANGTMKPIAGMEIKDIAALLKGDIGTSATIEFAPAAGGPHKTYKLLRHRAAPEVHSTSVRNVTFSPNGQFLTSIDDSGELKLWKLESPGSSDASQAMVTDRATIYCAAYTSKAGLFAMGADDNTIRLYNINTSKTQVLKGHEAAVLQVAFSPDGKQLASAASDGTVRLWNTDTFETENTISVADKNTACGVAYHPRLPLLATVDYQGVSLWDLNERKRLRRVDTSLTDVVCTFSPDGRHVACGGLDGTVTFVDLVEGRVSAKLRAHSGTIQELNYSPDGRFLASAGADKTAKVWNVAPEAERLWSITGNQQSLDVGGRTVDGSVSGVYRLGIQFTPDQQQLISVEGVSRVRYWDAATGRWLGGPQGDIDTMQTNGKLTCAALSADGTTLGCGTDGLAMLVDPKTGSLRTLLSGQQGVVGRIAFSHDGKLVATADSKSTLRIYKVADGKLVGGPMQAVIGDAKALGFSLDDHLLASIFGSNRVELWDVAKAVKVGDLTGQGESRPYSFAFDPDGKTLITGGFTGAIVAWNMKTGERIRTVGNHGGIVSGVAIDRKGKRLATCGIDQMVKIWDYETGDELLSLAGHNCSVHSVAFSADGQRVASVGEDGGIRLWDAALLSGDTPPATWWDAYLHGCVWADAGNWTQALADFDRATDLDKNQHQLDPHLWHERGLALAALGRDDEARRDFAVALKSLPDDGAIWLSGFVADAEAGSLNAAEDDYVKALARSRDAIGYSGNGDDLWINLRPSVQGDPGSWMLVTSNLSRQIDPDPEGSAWYLYRARGLAEAAQDGQRNYSQAGLDFNEAIKRKADDWQSWFGLGRSLMEVEYYKPLADRKLDNADAALSKAIELKADDWQLRCVRAVCRRNQKRSDEALADLDRAVELAPQELGPRLLRGNLLVDRANFAAAAKDLAAAVDAGAATNVRVDLAFVDLGLGTAEGAAGYQKICQYLLTKYDIANNARAANLVAWVWAMGPHPDPVPAQLISTVRAATADAKDNDPIQTLGGILYRANQDLTVARDMLLQSIKMQRGEGELADWLFLALVEQKLGNKADAQKWHDKAAAWLAAKPANAPPDDKLTNSDRLNLRQRVEATVLTAEYQALTGSAPASAPDAGLGK